MEASSDHLLGQDNENTIRKFRGQPTFKVYYGIMRKAAIIAAIQQRRLQMRMNAENERKFELLYWENHYDLDEEIEKDFSNSSMAITGNKATESAEGNFKDQNFAKGITEFKAWKSKGNFTLSNENFQLNQKIKTLPNELEPRVISPVQKPHLYRALHTYEYQVPPRMAIVLPTPLQGRAVWVDPNEYIARKRQYSGSVHKWMNVPFGEIWCLHQNERHNLRQDQLCTASHIGQNLYDIVGSLQSAAESVAPPTSQVPASPIKPKYSPSDVILGILLITLTIVVLYVIWTCSLPEELLMTLSGMYVLLITYIYSLVRF